MSASGDADGHGADPAGVLQDTDRMQSLEELGSNTYTAHRLQHASPHHLHLTTRRCFIGPIPEAWVSRHRKSWYKHRPHLSTYSSRDAAFESLNVSDLRTVTGLNAPQGTKFKPSFPQPADVRNEDDSEQTTETEAESDEDGQDELEQVRAEPTEVDDEESSRQASFREDDNNSPSHQEPSRPRLTKGDRSFTKKSVDTFTTARETQTVQSSAVIEPEEPASTNDDTASSSTERAQVLESGESTKGLLSRLSSRTKTASSRDGGSPKSLRAEHPRSQHAGPGSALNGSTSNLAADGPSAVPLSSQHSAFTSRKGDTGGAADQKRTSGDNAIAKTLEFGRGKPHASDLTRPSPITTGLVRFNVPEAPGPAQIKITDRPSRLRSKSALAATTKPGQLIKAERMLVKVYATIRDLPEDYTEHDSLKSESQLVETWKELIVVCRKNEDDSPDASEFVIQMNKTRVIQGLEKNKTRGVSHAFPLDKKLVRISMYSSLDKTIAIWLPFKKGRRIYILRPKSPASAVEWLTFLKLALGWQRPSTLNVHVPDLNVTLHIERPFRVLETAMEMAAHSESAQEARLQMAHGAVARDITARCMQELKESPLSEAAELLFESEERVGLAWKRYDRLEWIHGANEQRMYGSLAMQKSHDLELLPKKHYPCQVTTQKKKHQLEEPPPVEGFLVRLTSQMGRHSRFGKKFFKRLYFSTHNQYLCFCTPGRATPPKPPRIRRSEGERPPSASEIAEQVPLIYDIDPYPLLDDKISWMVDTTPMQKKVNDVLAYEESERQVKTLLETQGFLNLTKVRKIRKVKAGTHATIVSWQEGSGAESSSESSSDEEGERETTVSADSRTFELILANGLVVRLQAYNKDARKEWVKRLRKLSKYWRNRAAADIDLLKEIKTENLEQLDLDEDMEAIFGQWAQKWEVARARASPILYNMCGISCCRTITMAGVVYRKPRLHATFKRCCVILCHGKLLIFQSTVRRYNGESLPHIHHERQEVVDLKDTYVYSGLAAENDLLYHNQTFDSNHPGLHTLPRIYPDDSWTSSDEDTTTCFVIWHGRSKSLFRARSHHPQSSDGRNADDRQHVMVKQNLKYVASLGAAGRAMVFKTRSRVERDRWVMSLNTEIERLQEQEDIRVT